MPDRRHNTAGAGAGAGMFLDLDEFNVNDTRGTEPARSRGGWGPPVAPMASASIADDT